MAHQVKRALITGIAGQDGSYLAECLLKKGYEVHGIISNLQNSDNSLLWRLENCLNRINLKKININDDKEVNEIFDLIMPDEVYHLASNADPKVVFEDERKNFDTNLKPAVNLLRAIKTYKNSCKLYCAGSSLMFGDIQETPQNEQSRMNPTTPYGIAKVATFHFINMYRQAYGIFACMGILFNHESPRRDDRFLPKKITQAAARIKLGLQDKLVLGNIELKRDWSFAKDVVESMWLMMQAHQPRDYVIGSGELHSVRDILDIAFGTVGLNWSKFVVINDEFIRKIEYDNLCADSSKIKSELNWKPSLNFQEMITDMVLADLKVVEI